MLGAQHLEEVRWEEPKIGAVPILAVYDEIVT
jgi:hypothetical protein